MKVFLAIWISFILYYAILIGLFLVDTRLGDIWIYLSLLFVPALCVYALFRKGSLHSALFFGLLVSSILLFHVILYLIADYVRFDLLSLAPEFHRQSYGNLVGGALTEVNLISVGLILLIGLVIRKINKRA